MISLTALLLLKPSLVANLAPLPIMGSTTSNLSGFEAPPPPPPPSPSPQIPACVYGPFIVYFDWANDELSPQAQATLDNAASDYQICRQAQVVMAGHADRSGPDQYNVRLSQRRATNVRAYLARRGIPDGVMTTVALGESRPQVDTADGVREPLNRRVKITFGPDSDS